MINKRGNHSVVDGEKIEYRAKQYDKGEYDHHAADDLVDEHNAIVFENVLQLVNQPCQPIPPQQSSSHDAQIADAHLHGMAGNDEGQLCENGHEKQDDEGVGQRDQKGGDTVVQVGAFGQAAVVHVLCGVGAETDNAEYQQHDAAGDLEEETVLGIAHEIHHKTHAHTSDKGIEQITGRGSQTGHEAIPPPFVERALNTQYAYWSHRGGCKYTDYQSFKDSV